MLLYQFITDLAGFVVAYFFWQWIFIAEAWGNLLILSKISLKACQGSPVC